jgi:hypothetical protein
MKTARQETGFTLPTVAMLGVLAGFWMLGTAALVVPSMGRISAERARDVARSSAEAALDWGIQQLNDPTARSHVDKKNGVSVPSSLLGDPHYTATITVADVSPPVSSYLYDQTTDPNAANSTIQGGNGWRVVTASVNTNNGTVRRVRVILKPNYVNTVTPGVPIVNVVNGNPQSLFANAAYSIADLGGTGNLTTNSYDSDVTVNPTTFLKKYGNVGSNTDVALNGNTSIGGDVSVNSPIGQTDVNATGGPNVTVSGDVVTNGSASDFPGVDPSHVKEYQSNDPVKLPPAPSAPSGSADLGNALSSLAGNNTVTLSNHGATIGGTTIPTSGGNFIVSSIGISGNAKIVVDPSYGPVNVYVQGAGSSAGISLTGNSITGVTRPADIRIFYGGTGQTKIAGNGSLRGVIYAPNSDFKQTGNGVLYGAVVANTIDFVGNATFHYDVALQRQQDLMYIPKVTQITQGPNQNTQTISYFQAVSWDEL